MLKAVPFGEMTPDQGAEGVAAAINVFPDVQGYSPVKSFEMFAPAITGWLGGGAFVSRAGATAFLSGDATNLYRFGGAAWNSVLAHGATTWRFSQFGDNIICVNGNDPVTYDMGAGTAALTPDSPPPADNVAVVREFVVIAGDPANKTTVSWSGFNNSAIWTPGTQQSGSQELYEGGEITGLAGGEYGLVFQKTAVTRMTFVGDPLTFTFDKISENTGCMAKGSVTSAGRLVFFLSERGFYYTEGNDVTPIGVEKVDETFFNTYARSEIENIKAAIDPARHIVVWAMPGRLWVYNWSLLRWTVINLPNRGVFSGFNADISIDAVDAVFSADLDTLPVSLDSPTLQGGNPLFLVVNQMGEIGTLSGDTMEATTAIPDFELQSGISHVNCLRLVGDAFNSRVELRGKLHRGSDETVKNTGGVRANGDLPIRMRSRTFKAKSIIPAGEQWTYAKGLEFRYERGGRR